MKQQTFITCYYKSADDKLYSSFDRWTDKRVSTVLRKVTDLVNGVYGFGGLYDKYRIIRIYATPDGYHTEKVPALTWNRDTGEIIKRTAA